MRCTGDRSQTCGAGNCLNILVDTKWEQTFFARETYNTWSLMGCYVDSVATRTLNRGVSLWRRGGSANATIANCLDACQAMGYTYCGEEYYSECYGSTRPPTAWMASGG